MAELEPSLLDGLRTGRSAAFETFVGHFEGPLFRFFVCDHRDYHVAQEQTAETFAQLVRSLPMMRGDVSQLPAFVFTVARRIKQRNWRQPKVNYLSMDAAAAVADARPSPDTCIENRERHQQVMIAIGDLETNAREAMLLRYVEGHSIEQVAESLGIPSGTVKSLLHRAKQQVKQKLGINEMMI